MTNNEITVKNEFFISCLFIENMISNYIEEKIGILNSSKSDFNELEFELSFDDKVDFLNENSNLSIIDQSKVSAFQSIRKELLVNSNATTLEDCLVSNDNNGDFLLILYPQESFLPRNEKLTVACYNLMEDVSHLVSKYTNKTEVKVQNGSGLGSFLGLRNIAEKFGKIAMIFSLLLFK